MLTNETFKFLEELKSNNNRDWFQKNKKRYELVKEDYHNLVSNFLDIIQPLDPSLSLLEVKNCTFRINRDIRFSKNKTPYKTHLGIWMSPELKGTNRAGYYIHLEKGASFFAGGLYSPEPEDLKKVRQEIAYFYDDLNVILNDKNFKSTFQGLDKTENNCLKNPPRNYENEHPAIEYLKFKSFTTSHNFDYKEALQPDFVAKVTTELIKLKPLNDFLNRGLETI